MRKATKTRAKPVFSRQGIVVIAGTAILLLGLWAGFWLTRITESTWLAVAVVGGCGVYLFWIVAQHVFGADDQRIQALIDSADSLKDADFSFTIANQRNDEIGTLVDAYNSMVATLRAERQNLHQRELMLDTVIQASPLALVLTNDNDHVIYANATARSLFSGGRRFSGRQFIGQVIADQPQELRDALTAGQDAMVTVAKDRDQERYHLSCSDFTLNARAHKLFLLKHLTKELNRQEVATWKKVIRLIGHELNNSLAPISSLAHSAKLLVERGELARVNEVLDTVAHRSRHLKDFIEGYSRFAKLPLPRIKRIEWDQFFDSIRDIQPFQYRADKRGLAGAGDPEQLEQVFINLAKNSVEAGSNEEDIQVRVGHRDQGTEILVEDRGKGMSEEALANALLPFYSTKKSGSGLGLSLAREIVDAHAGRVSLRNRSGGGLSVRIWLPNSAAVGGGQGSDG
ncbi:MAG: ATP-binding protein [Pseudomonadota bacterium]